MWRTVEQHTPTVLRVLPRRRLRNWLRLRLRERHRLRRWGPIDWTWADSPIPSTTIRDMMLLSLLILMLLLLLLLRQRRVSLRWIIIPTT